MIEKVIEALRKDKKSAEIGLASARRGAKEAPSAMEFHSDTTRSQMQHLAESLEKDIREKEEGIAALQTMKDDFGSISNDSVRSGSLVSVSDDTGQEFLYFILPAGGSIKLKDGASEIAVVSATAPLARSLIGKRAGETALFAAGTKARHLKILAIH